MPQLLTLQRHERSEQGFTIMEMLVVILIIGVLVAIAIPAYLHVRRKSVDANTKTDVRNAVTMVDSALFTREVNIVPDTWVEGFTARGETDEELTALDILVGRTPVGTFSVPMAQEVIPALVKLSPGSRLSIGGTKDHYNVCGYNPGGEVAYSPDTAWVFERDWTKPRPARPDDECVEVAKRYDDDYNQDSPPTNPGDGDDNDGDGDGDGSGVTLPMTIEFGQPVPYHIMGNWADGVRFPVTVVTTEPELLKGIDQLPATLDGEPIQPVNIDGNTHGNLFMGSGWNTPGGLLEVKFGDQVIGSLDLSEYDFIGHAALDPSFVSTSRADLAAAVAWADAHFPGAGVVAWNYNADIDFLYGRADDSDIYDWGGMPDGMPALSGTESWNIYLDRVNGIAELKYWGDSDVNGSGARIVHLIEKSDPPAPEPEDTSDGNKFEPVGFDSYSGSVCEPHEAAFMDFQRFIYASYPSVTVAEVRDGLVNIYVGDEEWLDSTQYDGFGSEVEQAWFRSKNGRTISGTVTVYDGRTHYCDV